MATQTILSDGGRTNPVIRRDQYGNGRYTEKRPGEFAGAFIEDF
jgi:hypothetical protein